ncbi:MAG: tripartite tricarboxylate transporter substrate binding protein [Variovorax sp.]|nr:tripartite tricarboxylate transporter substrate binding protein [Variovorax sp.]
MQWKAEPVQSSRVRAMSRRSWVQGAAAIVSAGVGRGLFAQPTWPDRAIKWIVPFGAGSGADIVARVYGNAMAPALGQPIVIDNRAGASGAIGADLAARSPADGYTLFLASQSTHASNPGMFKKLPYDPVRSFDPVSLLGSFPLILVTHPSLPAQTVQELVAHARSNPGKLVFAYGTGSAQVTAELFRKLANADVLLVPYKSNPLALTAVVAGEAHCMAIDPGPGLPLMVSGRVRALAVTTGQRSDIVPQLPTMGEAGMPGYELFGWNALMVPAGTPAPIAQRLQVEVVAAARQPGVKQKLVQAGIDAHAGSSEELRQFMEAELAKWTAHIRSSGIVPE